MSGTIENTEGFISFEDILDITMVARYFEQLVALLNQSKPVVLEGGKIERIDGAGLQLLVGFFKTAESLQLPVQWQSCSEVLKKSAKLSGVTGSLGIK